MDTPQARTITTVWHPDYRLPTQIEKPSTITQFSYDDQGWLHTRSEQDTATGSARTWRYTYTAAGLLNTVDGPRTDVGDITDYDYDAQGNLIRTTDALGHITRIAAHDAHGRALTLIDANAVTTTLAYDTRGRLRSRTLGTGAEAARTAFEYDPVGQLTRLTLPTGATIDYRYDAAQRLIQIS
ncbi:MAG: type IV secretion protein Rhs, partial [bacterium]|nr:type IV secretion protein Rhs [bacterium]